MAKYSYAAMLGALFCASPVLAADLVCVTETICEGGVDCQAPTADGLQLAMKNWDQASPVLLRDRAELAMLQTKPAPIWRWSGTAAKGQTEVFAWREADRAFTYLVLEGGKTALKATGLCEVK